METKYVSQIFILFRVICIGGNMWLFSMESLQAIILNLISSIIFGATLWFTRNFWLERIINGSYLKMDTARIYPNNTRTNKMINKEISASSAIHILAIRGKSFADSDNSTCIYPAIWEDYNKTIEIMIADLNNNIIKDRSRALNIDRDEYELSIETLYAALKIRKRSFRNLKLYKHTTELPFRIIMLDECMFLFYYPESRSVHSENVIKYKKGSTAFFAFQKYYESVQKTSIEV